MNTHPTSWPALLVLIAGSAAAGDNDTLDALARRFPSEPTPAAETSLQPSEAEPPSPPCEEVDCFPSEPPLQMSSANSPPPAVEPATSLAPGQPPIAQSHAMDENLHTLSDRDFGGRMVYHFNEVSPVIICAPLRVCDIELQPGEIVQGTPHIGDGVRWKIAPAVSGSEDARVTHLIIKPTEAHLNTNLIVPTDRRTYHLRLTSSNRLYVSSVAFDYPDDEQRQAWRALNKANIRGTQAAPGESDLPKVAVNRLNFNYKIKVVKGKPTFKPLRAMDDGYHTYIAMNEDLPQREAPALIGISPDGSEQMINYRLKGNLYVIDGSVHKLALISGVGGDQQRIELTRNACEKRGWLGICWDSKE